MSTSGKRLQVFLVGLPKTGTTSVARIFEQHESRHEFMFGPSITRICDAHDGRITQQQVRRFVHARAALGGLEVDSASFNHFFLPILVEDFPDACFVYTYRDCFSWTNSFINMLIRWRGESECESSIPDWQTRYGNLLFGNFSPNQYDGIDAVLGNLANLVESYFRCWGELNGRILRQLPEPRTIRLETACISQAIQPLASFLQTPQVKLNHQGAHANRARWQLDVFDHLPTRITRDLYKTYSEQTMKLLYADPNLYFPPGKNA